MCVFVRVYVRVHVYMCARREFLCAGFPFFFNSFGQTLDKMQYKNRFLRVYMCVCVYMCIRVFVVYVVCVAFVACVVCMCS